MTNTTTAPTVTLQCAEDHDVTVPAIMSSGTMACPVEGCDSHADVSHAFRHVGWCTVCGGVDGDHDDDCAA